MVQTVAGRSRRCPAVPAGRIALGPERSEPVQLQSCRRKPRERQLPSRPAEAGNVPCQTCSTGCLRGPGRGSIGMARHHGPIAHNKCQLGGSPLVCLMASAARKPAKDQCWLWRIRRECRKWPTAAPVRCPGGHPIDPMPMPCAFTTIVHEIRQSGGPDIVSNALIV